MFTLGAVKNDTCTCPPTGQSQFVSGERMATMSEAIILLTMTQKVPGGLPSTRMSIFLNGLQMVINVIHNFPLQFVTVISFGIDV